MSTLAYSGVRGLGSYTDYTETLVVCELYSHCGCNGMFVVIMRAVTVMSFNKIANQRINSRWQVDKEAC